jgi:hypothetical protein
MALVGAPIRPTAPASSDVVTIDPVFEQNRQVVTGCQNIQDLTPYPGPYHGPANHCIAFPSQPVNFVWLHTGTAARRHGCTTRRAAIAAPCRARRRS